MTPEIIAEAKKLVEDWRVWEADNNIQRSQFADYVLAERIAKALAKEGVDPIPGITERYPSSKEWAEWYKNHPTGKKT